jgi:hypothetical protein
MHSKIKQLEDECIALEREGEDLEHLIKETIDREDTQREIETKEHMDKRQELKFKLQEHRNEIEHILSTPM